LRHRIMVGIGSQVEGLASVPASRRAAENALRALRQTGEKRTVAEIGEVTSTVLLQRLIDLSADEPELRRGAVADLAAHDASKGTNFVLTLEIYLDALANAEQAGRLLGVHANTVRHRVRQIEGLVAVHLDNPAERLGLMIQLRLLRSLREHQDRHLIPGDLP